MPSKYHSVERDVQEFCGWDKLLKIIGKAPEFTQALVATLFETGGRVSEVLKLKRRNFDFTRHEGYVIVKSMPIVKRREIGTRTFPISKSDPLYPYMEKWILKHRDDELLFPITRTYAFMLIRKLQKNLYPHWFRAQRASQLAFEKGFDVNDLVEFFGWKHFPTALRYARRGYKGLIGKV